MYLNLKFKREIHFSSPGQYMLKCTAYYQVLHTSSKTRMKFSRFALLCQVMVAYVPNEILQLKIISVLGSRRVS